MIFKKLCFWLGIFFIGVNCVLANVDIDKVNDTDKNFVNIYLFYADTCKHCEAERELLMELEGRYKNIRVYEYEVTRDENADLLAKVAELKGTTATGVPFTIIGDTIYKGYSIDKSKPRFMATIEYYLDYGYEDKVGEFIGNIELPEYISKEDKPSMDKYIDDYINYKIDFPLIGSVDTRNKTISVGVILMGIASMMKPYSLLGWLFLVGIFLSKIKVENKIKIGIAFLVGSIFMNMFFMMTGINLGDASTFMNVIRVIVGIMITLFIVIIILTYIRDRSRGKDRLDSATGKKMFGVNRGLKILGIVLLIFMIILLRIDGASYVNSMFLEYLSINNLMLSTKIVYMIVYTITGMAVDIGVFIILVKLLVRDKKVVN